MLLDSLLVSNTNAAQCHDVLRKERRKLDLFMTKKCRKNDIPINQSNCKETRVHICANMRLIFSVDSRNAELSFSRWEWIHIFSTN